MVGVAPAAERTLHQITRAFRIARRYRDVDAICKLAQMPDGWCLVTLTNTQEIRVSHSQPRALRRQLLPW